MAGKQVLRVKLEVVDEEGRSFGCGEERLEVTNIPGAWSMARVDRKESEKARIGKQQFEAVVAWFYLNHGPKQVEINQVPLIVLQSLLEQWHQSGHDVGKALLEALKIVYKEE